MKNTDDLFNKVSKRNLDRADQVRQQFYEKREEIYKNMNNTHSINKVKLSQFSARNPQNSSQLGMNQTPKKIQSEKSPRIEG